jgi:hypothetical protein
MIRPLAATRVEDLLREIGLPSGGSWDLSLIARGISDAQRALMDLAKEWNAPAQILTGATVILVASSQFADPTRRQASRKEWPGPCFHLVNEWLEPLGLRLVLRSPAADWEKALMASRRVLARNLFDLDGSSDADLNVVRRWLADAMCCVETGRSFAQLQLAAVTDPWPVSFLGCSITALGFDERATEESACRRLAGTLDRLGISAESPILRPEATAVPVRPDIGLVDEYALARSSLSIVVLRQPSLGLGYVVRFAADCGIPILVLTDLTEISPLARRLEGSLLTVRPLSGDVDATVREYVLDNWVHLSRFSADLTRRARDWQQQLDAFLRDLETVPHQLLATTSRMTMTRQRFRQLISSSHLWGRATRDEVEQLAMLVPPPLSEPAQLGLQVARDEARWSDDIVLQLEWTERRLEATAALEARSLALSRRNDPAQPAYWYRLRRDLAD